MGAAGVETKVALSSSRKMKEVKTLMAITSSEEGEEEDKDEDVGEEQAEEEEEEEEGLELVLGSLLAEVEEEVETAEVKMEVPLLRRRELTLSGDCLTL